MNARRRGDGEGGRDVRRDGVVWDTEVIDGVIDLLLGQNPSDPDADGDGAGAGADGGANDGASGGGAGGAGGGAGADAGADANT